MKKLFGALLLVTSFFVFSCSNGSENSNSEESEDATEENSVNYEFADKEHFLVLTNTSVSDIPFSDIPSAKGGRQAYKIQSVIQNCDGYSDELKIIDAVFDNSYIIDCLKNAEKYPEASSDDVSLLKASFTVSPVPSLEDVVKGGSYNFYINDTLVNNKIDLTVNTESTFVLKEIGETCKIWFRNSTQGKEEPAISDDQFTALASSLDSIFHKEMSIFGSNVISSYPNEFIQASAGTKLNVLIYDIGGDKVPSSETATYGGFFAPKDLYNSDSIQITDANNQTKTIKPNKCECIHIDSYLLKKDMDDNKKTTTSTIVHETQHLLHFINKTIKIQTESNTWYNEMLSLSAEDIFQTQLGLSDSESPKNRLSTFNAKYYDGFKNWRTGDAILYSYANVYAFGAFLMRNYGGVNLINKIANNNSLNEDSITEALHALNYNEDFTSVLKKFGEVIIYPRNTAKANLYKTVNQSFEGTNYSLTAIDLLTYGVLTNEESLQYIYDSANRKRTLADGRLVVIGPVILNAGASYVGGALGGYGTHAVYLGKVTQAPVFQSTAGVNQAIYLNE